MTGLRSLVAFAAVIATLYVPAGSCSGPASVPGWKSFRVSLWFTYTSTGVFGTACSTESDAGGEAAAFAGAPVMSASAAAPTAAVAMRMVQDISVLQVVDEEPDR